MRQAFALLLLLALCGNAHAQLETVTAIRTPGGGIQPQAVVDGAGELHLIYYTGAPTAGDIFYVHKPLSKNVAFSEPLRVNSKPKTAIAIGTIRGAQLALGSPGQLHVVWNAVGSKASDGTPRLSTAYTHSVQLKQFTRIVFIDLADSTLRVVEVDKHRRVLQSGR